MFQGTEILSDLQWVHGSSKIKVICLCVIVVVVVCFFLGGGLHENIIVKEYKCLFDNSGQYVTPLKWF